MVDEIDQISKNLKMIIYATYHGCWERISTGYLKMKMYVE